MHVTRLIKQLDPLSKEEKETGSDLVLVLGLAETQYEACLKELLPGIQE